MFRPGFTLERPQLPRIEHTHCAQCSNYERNLHSSPYSKCWMYWRSLTLLTRTSVPGSTSCLPESRGFHHPYDALLECRRLLPAPVPNRFVDGRKEDLTTYIFHLIKFYVYSYIVSFYVSLYFFICPHYVTEYPFFFSLRGPMSWNARHFMFPTVKKRFDLTSVLSFLFRNPFPMFLNIAPLLQPSSS